MFSNVKTQSAKICLNLNWGGGVFWNVKTQCQDLPKFQFLGVGVFWKVKTQSAKICLNLNCGGGGGGYSGKSKPKVPRFA